MIDGPYLWLMLAGMLLAPRLALGVWLCAVGHSVLGGLSIVLGLVALLLGGNATK